MPLSPGHLGVLRFGLKRTLKPPWSVTARKNASAGRTNALHGYIICLIPLPVNAPVVEFQNELSLHLLQEEAQAPGDSLSRIMLLPIPAEPTQRLWIVGLHASPGSLASTDAPKASCCFRALFSPQLSARLIHMALRRP